MTKITLEHSKPEKISPEIMAIIGELDARYLEMQAAVIAGDMDAALSQAEQINDLIWNNRKDKKEITKEFKRASDSLFEAFAQIVKDNNELIYNL